MPGEAQAPTTATSAPAKPTTRRSWLRPSLIGLWAGVAAAASVITQFASKANASATLDSTHAGAVRYDAGWPWAYAQVAVRGLGRADWEYAAHSPPRVSHIYWGVFAIDAALLALIFTLGLGLLIGLWGITWGIRHKGSLKHFLRHAGVGLGAAIAWAILSAFLIGSASDTATTDQVTWAQVSQFPTAELLAPGVIQFAIGRWFESDHGLAIALTGGLASQIEACAQFALGVLAPAAVITFIVTSVMNIRAWWAKQ